MRITIFTILTLISSITFAETQFEFWVWEGVDASNNPLTIEIKPHGMCSGKIVKIKTNTMPANLPELVPEKVYEYSKEGKKLNSWNMPVDYIVYGIEGKNIITGHGSLKRLLKVDTSGKLSSYDQIKYKAKNIKCPMNTNADLAYKRCFSYKDLNSGKKRILSYQGPCT